MSMATMSQMMIVTSGMRNRVSHQPRRPAILISRYVSWMEMIAPHPGLWAFAEVIHIPAMARTSTMISMISIVPLK